MTPGERSVWAAAYVAALDRGASGEDAATWGTAAVNVLRSLPARLPADGGDVRVAVVDMLEVDEE